MSNISFNIPLMAIPAYYLLAILPHGVAISRVARASRGSSASRLQAHDNRNPKSVAYTENARKKLTPREFAAWERAESCHRNHLENAPLFIATIFAALLAEQKIGVSELGLTSFVLGWMGIRLAYTANYLYSETQVWSYLRSLLYFWGQGWAFLVLGRAAYALGN